MPDFIPKIRVEVYVPIRFEPAYKETLYWLIEEFTELHGGCTVNEHAGGYYLSKKGEVIADKVSVVYSDFPLNWGEQSDRADALHYCSGLQNFLLENLWEEEILIAAFPVSHTFEDSGKADG